MSTKKNFNKILGDFNAVPKIIYESILYGEWEKALLVPYTQIIEEKNSIKSIQKIRHDELAIVITDEECHYGFHALLDYIETNVKELSKKNNSIDGLILRGKKNE